MTDGVKRRFPHTIDYPEAVNHSLRKIDSYTVAIAVNGCNIWKFHWNII